ncbi:inovirus-type Gp2 protein [Lentisphaerota bacterium WC36G]|nr:inovirus Gp2 family protein [Lentisphaerae bacterium WC36]
MKNLNKIVSPFYNGLPLLKMNDNSQEFYEIILEKIYERINAMHKKTSQVLFIRFEIRFPQNLNATSDNKCFKYYINEYRRYFNNNNFFNHYVWVKEQNCSHNPHYHLLLMIDGNRMRYYKNNLKATEIWSRALKKYYDYNIDAKGLIQVCGYTHGGVTMNNGINVHRDNMALRNELFKICSYLAKTYTKENIITGRFFGASVLGYK